MPSSTFMPRRSISASLDRCALLSRLHRYRTVGWASAPFFAGVGSARRKEDCFTVSLIAPACTCTIPFLSGKDRTFRRRQGRLQKQYPLLLEDGAVYKLPVVLCHQVGKIIQMIEVRAHLAFCFGGQLRKSFRILLFSNLL